MVSVIVPVYNAEQYLRRCLNSIITQPIQELEIILVDDGSFDNSLDIIREYADRDDRIIVLSQGNKGVAAARNTGLKVAKGEYLLYVDADDWLDTRALEYLLSYMQEDIDIVFCAFDNAEAPEDIVYEKQDILEKWDHTRQIHEFILHKRMSGMLWNKLIRRRLTKGIEFNERTGYGEDAEFLWKIIQKSRNMIVSNKVLYHHVLEKNSISHLPYSEKKYTSIPMWEKINADVKRDYPQLWGLAKVSLATAAVYGLYEARKSAYKNKEHLDHMRAIIRENIVILLKAEHVSMKLKFYAIFLCLI